MVTETLTMSLSSRREYLTKIHDRYQRAGRPHKSRILDEFCLNCGDHRKAALRLLHRPPRAGPAKRSGPEIIYDPVALLPVQAGLAGERPVVQINRIKVVRPESESRPHSYQG